MSKKRLWNKKDIIVPRIRKCPERNLVIEIIGIDKDSYTIRVNGKKTILEHKYLEGSYLTPEGKRVYNWVLISEGDKDGKDTNAKRNEGTRSKRKRKTKTDDTVQENSKNGSVR